jgi:hypothetical protein
MVGTAFFCLACFIGFGRVALFAWSAWHRSDDEYAPASDVSGWGTGRDPLKK